MCQRITDVEVLSGGIVIELCGAPPEHNPKRMSCIVTAYNAEWEWMFRPSTRNDFHISNDGKQIEWPSVNRHINIDDVLANTTLTYFLKWSRKELRAGCSISEAVGCWRTPSGHILIHPSGFVKIKLTGKGTSSDVPGDWVWENLNKTAFAVYRKDITPKEELGWRMEYRTSRYDGRILELESRSLFNLDPKGIPGPILWVKSKLPKTWCKWAWD